MGNARSSSTSKPPIPPPPPTTAKAPAATVPMKRELQGLAIAALHCTPSVPNTSASAKRIATSTPNPKTTPSPAPSPSPVTSPVIPHRRRSRAGRRLSRPGEWWKSGGTSAFHHQNRDADEVAANKRKKKKKEKKKSMRNGDRKGVAVQVPVQHEDLDHLEASPVTTDIPTVQLSQVGSDKETPNTPATREAAIGMDKEIVPQANSSKIATMNGADLSSPKRKSPRRRSPRKKPSPKKRTRAAVAPEEGADVAAKEGPKEENGEDGDEGSVVGRPPIGKTCTVMSLSPASVIPRTDANADTAKSTTPQKKGKRKLFSKAAAMEARPLKRRKTVENSDAADTISASRKDKESTKGEELERMSVEEGVSITTGSQGLQRGNRMAVFDFKE